MGKKFVPFIALILAGLLLWFIKTYQRGTLHTNVKADKNQPAISNNGSVNNNSPEDIPSSEENLNRHAARIIYSRHAKCRMECRHIDESEVKEILDKGTINYNKIESDSRGKTYPLEGITHDHQHVRIVFAPKGEGVVEVVTCIDLDTDWPCNCY